MNTGRGTEFYKAAKAAERAGDMSRRARRKRYEKWWGFGLWMLAVQGVALIVMALAQSWGQGWSTLPMVVSVGAGSVSVVSCMAALVIALRDAKKADMTVAQIQEWRECLRCYCAGCDPDTPDGTECNVHDLSLPCDCSHCNYGGEGRLHEINLFA